MEAIKKLVAKNGKGEGTLVGVDGNAYMLMGYTQGRLEEAGWSRKDIDAVMEQAMSGDYNNLIRVCSSTLLEE